jgi:hypothetical protein
MSESTDEIPLGGSDFYLEVAYALSGCQLVEEELKRYISDAFDLVRKFVGARMAFKLCGDQYIDSSLERLIDMFKKLSDNRPLVDALMKFKEKRNFLSHRGIARHLDPDGELDFGALEFKHELIAMRDEAARLRAAIWDEGGKFRGHLWFETVPNPLASSPSNEIPDEWWSFCEMDTFKKVLEHYFYEETPDVRVVPLSEIEPPSRLPGVPELLKFRMVSVLCAFKYQNDGRRPSLPPCKAEESPAGSAYKFKLVDGFHRFYASKAVEYSHLPVVIVSSEDDF